MPTSKEEREKALKTLRDLAFNASTIEARRIARKGYKDATGRSPKREEGDKH